MQLSLSQFHLHLRWHYVSCKKFDDPLTFASQSVQLIRGAAAEHTCWHVSVPAPTPRTCGKIKTETALARSVTWGAVAEIFYARVTSARRNVSVTDRGLPVVLITCFWSRRSPPRLRFFAPPRWHITKILCCLTRRINSGKWSICFTSSYQEIFTCAKIKLI